MHFRMKYLTIKSLPPNLNVLNIQQKFNELQNWQGISRACNFGFYWICTNVGLTIHLKTLVTMCPQETQKLLGSNFLDYLMIALEKLKPYHASSQLSQHTCNFFSSKKHTLTSCKLSHLLK
jgi:hypothetical protein